jgi:hypothetical protein
VAERPGDVGSSLTAEQLDAKLLDASARYPVPTPEELKAMSPANRRIILQYFELLNRGKKASGGTGG